MKDINVDMVNKVYESKSGEMEGRVVGLTGGRAMVETCVNGLWVTDSRHATTFDACEVLEEILNNH